MHSALPLQKMSPCASCKRYQSHPLFTLQVVVVVAEGHRDRLFSSLLLRCRRNVERVYIFPSCRLLVRPGPPPFPFPSFPPSLPFVCVCVCVCVRARARCGWLARDDPVGQARVVIGNACFLPVVRTFSSLHYVLVATNLDPALYPYRERMAMYCRSPESLST